MSFQTVLNLRTLGPVWHCSFETILHSYGRKRMKCICLTVPTFFFSWIYAHCKKKFLNDLQSLSPTRFNIVFQRKKARSNQGVLFLKRLLLLSPPSSSLVFLPPSALFSLSFTLPLSLIPFLYISLLIPLSHTLVIYLAFSPPSLSLFRFSIFHYAQAKEASFHVFKILQLYELEIYVL